MYAMLTGTLPFTVEPFSLNALHQKMVDKEMNPLPSNISSGIGKTPSLDIFKILKIPKITFKQERATISC